MSEERLRSAAEALHRSVAEVDAGRDAAWVTVGDGDAVLRSRP